MGIRQIHLGVLVRTAGCRPPKKKISCIEIEMESLNVLAGKKADLMIVFPGPQSFFHASARKCQRVADGQRRNNFRLMMKPVLKSKSVVTKSRLGGATDRLP